ncbi:hypothetical protein Tco_0666071 [Tanacetum coccineum]
MPKRKDPQVPQSGVPSDYVADEAVNEEMDDSLDRAATTATSLDVEKDRGNIDKTQSKATPNEPSSPGTSSGGGPRRQETMGDTIAQTRSENELMELCTNLQQRVLDLETIKTTQANEITSLKRRVKKLEQKKRSGTHGLKRLYKVGLIARVESPRDEESLDDADMFDVNTLTGDEVLAEPEVAVKDVNLSIDEVTLAQALAALRSAKVQEKGDVVEERSIPVSAASTKVSAATTITTATIPTPRKELFFKSQNGDIHAKIEADHELAQRLQAQEQEELSDAEKATLFV